MFSGKVEIKLYEIIFISAFNNENFIKIKEEMFWQEFKKNHGNNMKYIGNILVQKDFWPITVRVLLLDRGRDRMVDEFKTTCAISAYHH